MACANHFAHLSAEQVRVIAIIFYAVLFKSFNDNFCFLSNKIPANEKSKKNILKIRCCFQLNC